MATNSSPITVARAKLQLLRFPEPLPECLHLRFDVLRIGILGDVLIPTLGDLALRAAFEKVELCSSDTRPEHWSFAAFARSIIDRSQSRDLLRSEAQDDLGNRLVEIVGTTDGPNKA